MLDHSYVAATRHYENSHLSRMQLSSLKAKTELTDSARFELKVRLVRMWLSFFNQLEQSFYVKKKLAGSRSLHRWWRIW